jgi:hypothetical protein
MQGSQWYGILVAIGFSVYDTIGTQDIADEVHTIVPLGDGSFPAQLHGSHDEGHDTRRNVGERDNLDGRLSIAFRPADTYTRYKALGVQPPLDDGATDTPHRLEVGTRVAICRLTVPEDEVVCLLLDAPGKYLLVRSALCFAASKPCVVGLELVRGRR